MLINNQFPQTFYRKREKKPKLYNIGCFSRCVWVALQLHCRNAIGGRVSMLVLSVFRFLVRLFTIFTCNNGELKADRDQHSIPAGGGNAPNGCLPTANKTQKKEKKSICGGLIQSISKMELISALKFLKLHQVPEGKSTFIFLVRTLFFVCNGGTFFLALGAHVAVSWSWCKL